MSKDRRETFELKEEHLILLRNMFVDWDDSEFGAPAVNSKRPYGNSSVFPDIADLLGIQANGDGSFTEEQESEMYELHRGTLTALQIILIIGKAVPGKYKKTDKYDSRSWVPA